MWLVAISICCVVLIVVGLKYCRREGLTDYLEWKKLSMFPVVGDGEFRTVYAQAALIDGESGRGCCGK
jgi:hypothetical protein